ncbi:uncharacterized protein [Watersipora subatra]|uniref:uncharacterized protein n=1 Tax=Watersipora subatra TaxID=2589382 RepID=UPI00355C4A2C
MKDILESLFKKLVDSGLNMVAVKALTDSKNKKSKKKETGRSRGGTIAGWIIFFIVVIGIAIALWIFCKMRNGWTKTRGWLSSLGILSYQVPTVTTVTDSNKVIAMTVPVPAITVTTDQYNPQGAINVTLSQPVNGEPVCYSTVVNAQGIPRVVAVNNGKGAKANSRKKRAKNKNKKRNHHAVNAGFVSAEFGITDINHGDEEDDGDEEHVGSEEEVEESEDYEESGEDNEDLEEECDSEEEG